LAVSGQLGVADGALVHGGVADETRQALANMAALLEGEGAGLSSVVKTNVYLRHMNDFAVMNDAYIEAFGDHRPARAAVAVAGLPLNALVEIEAWAYLPTEA
jgi:2-iminobutanoate/2-iminopropanoate deaminase